MPVKPSEQVLVMRPTSKSVGALLLCLSVQSMFDLPPLVRDVHFGG